MDAAVVFPIFLTTLVQMVDVDHIWAMMALNPDGDLPRTLLWLTAACRAARKTLNIRAVLAAGQRGVWIPTEGNLPGWMRACNALSRLQLLPHLNPMRGDDLDAITELLSWDAPRTTQLVLSGTSSPTSQVIEPRAVLLARPMLEGWAVMRPLL